MSTASERICSNIAFAVVLVQHLLRTANPWHKIFRQVQKVCKKRKEPRKMFNEQLKDEDNFLLGFGGTRPQTHVSNVLFFFR